MSLVVASQPRDLAPPPAAQDDDALLEGLQQRARLFGRILADLAAPRTLLQAGLLPQSFLPQAAEPRGPRRYGADLVLCPDQTWRVTADLALGIDGAPLTTLFDAPGLAVFLPGLCRFLLREPLRLASVPTRWLGDPQSIRDVTQNADRWAIVDAFRPGPTSPLLEMTVSQRTDLQSRVDEAPWRFAARLSVTGPRKRIFP